MEYRYMGRTGLKVSELCLGAMEFGRTADEETSHRIMDHFFEAGGNFIDTADVYNAGVSEEILGRWMKGKKRDALIIATKVRGRMGPGPNDEGLSRKHILASVDASLHRMGTDYIDLYQVHSFDFATPLDETLSTLNHLVEIGKVRYLGASNFAGWQLQKAIDLSRQMGWEVFTCLQPLYNLLDRGVELELIPVCLNEGVGVIPWSPLRGGWLSGKYQRGMSVPPQGTRVDTATQQGWSESWQKYDTGHTWKVIDELMAIAQEIGKSPAQIALNWLLQKPVVTAPIIGMRNVQQLEDNLGASGWRLETKHMERLDNASKEDLPYPYWIIQWARRRS